MEGNRFNPPIDEISYRQSVRPRHRSLRLSDADGQHCTSDPDVISVRRISESVRRLVFNSEGRVLLVRCKRSTWT
jgi:hypothetical protein